MPGVVDHVTHGTTVMAVLMSDEYIILLTVVVIDLALASFPDQLPCCLHYEVQGERLVWLIM